MRNGCTIFLITCAASILLTPDNSTAQITNWNSRPGWGNVQPQSIAYGNGFYLAIVNGNSYLVSSNGSDWTLRLPPFNIYGSKVRFVTGQFCALANPLLSTADGLNWTSRPLPLNPSGIAYGSGKYVIVSSSSSAPNIAYSTNALEWTIATAAQLGLSGVVYGSGVFVAYGPNPNGGILTSTDGIFWTYPTNVPYVTSVCYGNGTFLAASGNTITVAYRSTDGYTWAATSTNAYMQLLYSGLGNFVALGTGTSYSWTSTNTFDWTLMTSTGPNWYDCTFSPTTAYIIGSGPTFAESNPLTAPGYAPSSLQPMLYPGIQITGNLGSHYRIEYSDTVPQTNWTTATELYLHQNPTLWIDPQAPTGHRFYRSIRLD